jgi:hypothetical protein
VELALRHLAADGRLIAVLTVGLPEVKIDGVLRSARRQDEQRTLRKERGGKPKFRHPFAERLPLTIAGRNMFLGN